MASKPNTKIELFYDVVSPYAWIGFEVCVIGLDKAPFENLCQYHQLFVYRFFLISLYGEYVSWVKQICYFSLQLVCRYRQKWGYEVDFKPFFLGGVMQGAGIIVSGTPI